MKRRDGRNDEVTLNVVERKMSIIQVVMARLQHRKYMCSCQKRVRDINKLKINKLIRY